MENVQVVKAFGPDENDYEFMFPRLSIEVKNVFWDAVEIMDGDPELAIYKLKKYVSDSPEDIDAWAHIGFCYQQMNDRVQALSYLHAAVAIGNESIPFDFNSDNYTLRWILIDNRGYLRALHGLGLEYQYWQLDIDAERIYRKILKCNPDDNQGVRELLSETLLANQKYNELINVYEADYPGMIGFDVNYILSLIASGRIEEATESIKSLLPRYTRIIKEIVKKRHRKPKDSIESVIGYASENGQYRAYDYWKRCGRYWENVDGALDLVRTILRTEKVIK